MGEARGLADSADYFDTATLRARVLAAWSAAPARFREDANAEEDYALGAYRDRLVVELAQNAADAAIAAGVPGRLRLVLDDDELRAVNAGAPLDAAGVESLSTLRASAKREGPTTGRFGVGFAAVLSVSDEPRIRSTSGGVAWSRPAVAGEVAAVPALADELGRREGHVPALRLPYPCDEAPPDGYDTEVVLPLRDAAAKEYAHRLLVDVGPALLLGLPALRTVQLTYSGVVRELRASWDESGALVETDDGGVVTRWRIATRAGELDQELLADRPAEERARPHWSVRWAVPLSGDDLPRPLPAGVSPVLHGPTPSDEPVDVPALLLASFPLDPARRHVAPGALTDYLVTQAAETYADLVTALPADPAVLELVPGPVSAGVLDGKVRQAVHDALPGRAFLPTAAAGPAVVPPDATAADVPAGLIDVLAEVLPGLLPAGWSHRGTALRLLGVRELGLGDVVDLLATLRRDPAWWQRVYAELESVDRDALPALPVPLADGRTVRGPRGVLLPTADLDVEALSALGVRVVDAEAVHPLLGRLGAVEGNWRAVLDDPHVRAAVAGSYEADDPEVVAAAVLPAVRASTLEPGDEPWLAALALRDSDGDVRVADELLLPDGPMAQVVSADAPFGAVAADLAEQWGGETLARVGVVENFAIVRDEDLPLDPDECDHDLDGEDAWIEDTLAVLGAADDVPPVLVEFVAVRDLDLVAPDRWGDALRLLGEPTLRAAIVEPATVLLGDGRRSLVPSYTAWWLRTSPIVDGRRPADLRTADADPLLAALYDEAPAGDTALLAAVGVRTTVAALLSEASGVADLLARLVEAERSVTPVQLHGLYSALADGPDVDVQPPERLRVVQGTGTVVVDAADVVVLDAPDLLPLLGDRPVVAVRRDRVVRLAALLDLPLASELVSGHVESTGDVEPVPDLVRGVVPGAPASYLAHDPLVVDGTAADWRYVDGEIHAASLTGLARGVAWAGGHWEQRHLLAALLSGDTPIADLLAEARLDAWP
ncbi:MAG: hypothetical protein GEV07_14985 [Streptosporangiales bacterium]|nr:hypothetical protein [Streptosporangiales bacterium]